MSHSASDIRQHRLVAMDEVATTRDKPGLVPFSPSHIKRLIDEGEFPEPFYVGLRKRAWKLSTILDYIEKLASETKPEVLEERARLAELAKNARLHHARARMARTAKAEAGAEAAPCA